MSNDILKTNDLAPRAKDLSPEAAKELTGGISADTTLGTQVKPVIKPAMSGTTTVAVQIKTRG